MRLLSYNIQYGYGRDGAYRLDRVANVVKSADIVALQEVDRHWQRTNYDDQPALLAQMLPDHYMVYGAGFDMDAATETTFGTVHREEPANLSQDAFKRPRLITAGGFYHVPVHRVARPNDGMPFTLHSAHQSRQPALNLVIAIT